MIGWDAAIGWMGWLGWLGPLAMVLFWVAVIALPTWLVSSLWTRPTTGETSENTALEILRRRYARGEITQAEYDEGRRVLGI